MAVGTFEEIIGESRVPSFEELAGPGPRIQYDPKADHQRIIDTIDISDQSEIPLPVVHSNLETARQSIEKQNKAAQKVKQRPFMTVGMAGPYMTGTMEDVISPVYPVQTLKEIGKAIPRFLEQQVGGTFGGTVYDWMGQFIEQGGIAVDQLSKLGMKDPDRIHNPLANSIIAAGQELSGIGKKYRELWIRQGATGWEALDEKLKETDPISYGAGRLTEGVASSALSVLAVYLSGGAAAPLTLADKGLKINRGLVVLSGMSAAGGFEHAQEQRENFAWSTLHGLTDGAIEYFFESSFLEGIGKGSSALTAGFKEGGEEFVTGMLQNTRAGILENEKRGMSAYEGAKDAVIKALKQAPWEVAAGFIGGWGMVGGANLVNITKKANAMPIVSAEAETPAQPVEKAPGVPVAGQTAEIGAVESQAAGVAPPQVAAAKPITMKAYRAETGTESLRPSKHYALNRKMAQPEIPPGEPIPEYVVKEEQVTLQKPLVVEGLQGNILDKWSAEGDTKAQALIEEADAALAVGKPKTPDWFIRADTYIAQKAEQLGYDGILYNAGERSEIVTLQPAPAAEAGQAERQPWEMTREEFVAESGVGSTAEVAKAFVTMAPNQGIGIVTLGKESVVRSQPAGFSHTWENGKTSTGTTFVLEDTHGGKRILVYYDAKQQITPSDIETGQPLPNPIGGIRIVNGKSTDVWIDSEFQKTGLLRYLMNQAKQEGITQIAGPFSSDKLANLAHKKAVRDAVKESKIVPRAVLEEYKSEPWAQEALGKVRPGLAPGATARAGEGEKGALPLAGPAEGAEPSGGVSWDTAVRTGLTNAEAVIPKVKREQRKTLKQKVGAMMGVRESLLKKGVSPQEAIWRSSGQLRGPHTDYEQRYIALDDVVEPWVIEAALRDIVTNPRLGPFDPINLTNPEGTGAFDKFRKGTYLTKGEVELLKKWNDLIGEEAAKRIPWTVKLFSFLEEVLGVFKAPAGYDVQIRRQAGWIRGRHPKLYTEAIANDLAAYMSQARADALAEQTEDDPRHQDAIDHGVRFLDREDPNIEQYLGEKIIAKIPKIGPAYKAAMRGFIDSFNWLQQQLWNQKMEAWGWKNVDVTDEMKNDLADFNNTILGMAKAKSTFGAMARRVLAPVMWSPTLTWSRIRTPSMLLTNPTMRGEVAATLSSYIASGLLLMIAASMIARWRDEEDVVEWDPRSVDFGKIKIGNTRFDVYVDGGPYIRLLIQLAFGEKKNQAGRLRPRDRIEVIKQFVRNKRAPIFDFIGQIWTGRTYYGGEAWKLPDWEKQKEDAGLVKREVIALGEKLTESDLGEKTFLAGREIYERFTPFFVQAQLEAMWNDGIIVGLMAGADEFLSGQVMSYEPSTFARAQILQDTAALDTYKKTWENLSAQQQDTLRKKFPQIEELEIQADGEMLPPDEISLAEQNRAAEKIMDALPKDMRNELASLSVRISAPSRNLGKFRLNDSRYEMYQIYAQKEIEKALNTLFANTSWASMDKTKKIIRTKGRIDDAKARARERLRNEIAQGKL